MRNVTGGSGPHTGRPVATAGAPLAEATGALILVHGRGGSADEMLGLRLLSLHNVHFLVALMRAARDAIASRSFDSWSTRWLDRYHSRSDSDE